MTAFDKNKEQDSILSPIVRRYKQLEILPLYILAFSLYLFPLIPLFLFIVDQSTFHKTEMLFWLLFLLSIMPCGLGGFVVSIIGLTRSFKQKSTVNKIIGWIAVLLGSGAAIAGLLGIGLILLVIS